MLKMEKVKLNVVFLSKLVHESRNKCKDILKNATDEEIITLIELILNFENFGEHECAKNIKKHLTILRKIQWNLRTARVVFIKNLNHLKPLLSVVIIFLIESEVCEII